MGVWAILLIVGVLAFMVVAVVTISVNSWVSVQRAKHKAKGSVSEEILYEIRAEIAEVKENLVAINHMLREVQ